MLDVQAVNILKVCALLRHLTAMPEAVEEALMDNILELTDIVETLDRLANEIA
jgi:hypothetical protein